MSVVPATAQIVESVGERALGMGGAFVAVASDSSATWWNPAALADGPFFDLSIGRATEARDFGFPAGRDRVSGFALSTPVVGASFRRVALVSTAPVASIGQPAGGRENEGGQTALTAWSGSALGGTIVQTLFDGTHVGATLKYVRGAIRTGTAAPGSSPETAIDQAGDLDDGRAESQFDLDIGALATAGAVRLGVVVRNVRAASFGDGAFRLPRQARVGVAFSAEAAGGPPLTVSVDADLREYESGSGRRRVIAVGAEQWLAGKRLGLRAGARFNQAGHEERALTAGASIAIGRGSILEAHVVGGGSPAEQGWGTGVRVSF
ncbi:MAG: hypothetical protein ABL986_12020 [Vicinamibacterales bacterium]